MTRLDGWKRAWAVVLLCVATGISSPAQTFNTLLSFNSTNGSEPFLMSLIQGPDGGLYGTTVSGGMNGGGTVFRVTSGGDLRTLYNFCASPFCTDGGSPWGTLILGADNNFYGTTAQGGATGRGTVYRITPTGVLTVLYSFCAQTGCPDGQAPTTKLLQAADGNFYGTTRGGGSVRCDPNFGCGTVFKITPEGALTTVYVFDWPNGAYPQAGLVQTTAGSFYGTTSLGGDLECNAPYGCGTVFEIRSNGQLTTLHAFEGVDGAVPNGDLVQDSIGNFYGTTYAGGTDLTDCAFGCGTVYKINLRNALTTLHSFSFTDGAYPQVGIVLANDGTLFGTAFYGGDAIHCARGCGNIFQIALGGAFNTLHIFGDTDGADPNALLQATDGRLYSTTYLGGDLTCNSGLGCGTVFSLDLGLNPFVAFVRDSGKVGGTGGILGQGFTGTTGVSLNGTPAKFRVISDTFLRAQVPAGGTSGFVIVTTPSGSLTSNKIFRVTPQLLSFDPPSGRVGTQVTITGVSLTQTQGVGFGNHVPAQFTVNSDTQVTATVPSGAKTGRIGIETKGGTAISTVVFTVTP